MLRRAKPVPDPDKPGQYPANGARAKSGLSRSISDAGWGRFVSVLRAKAEEAGRIWIEVDPRHTSHRCENCGHAAPRIASPKRPSNASDAHIAPRLTNTPRVTSYGLDWPFTRKPREKKPAASSRRRSHVFSADDACSDRRPMFPAVHWITRRGRSAVVVLIGCSPRSASRVRVPTGESVRLGWRRRVRRPS